MSRTRHMQRRMKERAIGQSLVELTLQFGEPYPDGKFVLNQQALKALMRELKIIEKVAQKASDKGGLVVVREGEALITTYRLDSYDRRARRHQEAA